MSLLDKLEDLQTLSWEASVNGSFESTELTESTESDSDSHSQLSMCSEATSVQSSVRRPDSTKSAKMAASGKAASLRPLPTSRGALASAFDSLGTMLECLEGSAEAELMEIETCLNETIAALKNAPAWDTTIIKRDGLFPCSSSRSKAASTRQ
ncbi:hypothetical protein CJJ07_001983 [Candidozyma auris]|nr:hypothetical protein CJJ07_001983 [[Candida] auris]QEL60233.1 hypothetical protein CJJ09_002331 [[Candida] auris]